MKFIATQKMKNLYDGFVPESLPVPLTFDDPPKEEVTVRKPKGLAWDIRMVRWTVRTFVSGGRWYEKGRSFLLHHSKGWIKLDAAAARAKHCDNCMFRGVRGTKEFCSAENCDCGHHRLAELTYKRRLRNWHCPMGHF